MGGKWMGFMRYLRQCAAGGFLSVALLVLVLEDSEGGDEDEDEDE